ncbi:glycoside hydrolase family 10 protein [candidate division KSB1 bacterium]
MNRYRSMIIFLFASAAALSACGREPTPPSHPNNLELRGVWLTPKWETIDWDATMSYLADYGINTVFPYMHSAGGSFYPSSVIPWATNADQSRDHLEACVEAAAEHGIEVHVWRINWAMYGGDRNLRDKYATAGRVQRTDLISRRGKRVFELDGESDYGGFGTDFLCPDISANRALELDSMVEAARNYPVAGVHFDYMRYPDMPWCYCDSTRARYQRETGEQISDADWPTIVQEGGADRVDFRDWRNNNMTELAGEIAEAVRAASPGVKVSLAARGGISWAIRSDAQNWPRWCRDGVLDFVSPMDYTPDREQLQSDLSAQMTAVGGSVPIHVGLGVYQMETADELVGHVRLINAMGANGFVLFDYDACLGKLKRLYDDVLSREEIREP